MSEHDGRLGGKTERSIRGTRLADRILRELWPISKPLRGLLIDRLAGIVQDRRASPTNLRRPQRRSGPSLGSNLSAKARFVSRKCPARSRPASW